MLVKEQFSEHYLKSRPQEVYVNLFCASEIGVVHHNIFRESGSVSLWVVRATVPHTQAPGWRTAFLFESENEDEAKDFFTKMLNDLKKPLVSSTNGLLPCAAL